MNGRYVFSSARAKICRWCIDTSSDLDLPVKHRNKASHQYCEQKTLGNRCDCPTCWPDPREMRTTADMLDVLKLDVPKK